MVDLNTAMAAASADRQKRMVDETKERKKRRSGKDLGIEAFDPVQHVAKEKAETASMWLVIAFSVIVSLLMRYVLMPNTSQDNSDILYLLPLSAIVLIPQLHRMVMPKRFVEIYTKGTWFKAGFLHAFTFLAMAFLLVNPPMGDIVAPQLSGKWTIVTSDGTEITWHESNKTREGERGTLEWTVEPDSRMTGDAWLLFGLADNVGVGEATVAVTLSNNNGEGLSMPSNESFWDENIDQLNENYQCIESSPGECELNSAGEVSHRWHFVDDYLRPHGELDQMFAVNIGTDLQVGEHQITVEISEQGDPWINTRTYSWTLNVVESLPEPAAS
ncbi:MAG: hypothetical protein CMA63_05470 [Euryarchaeota archaeon]|nr:hypothetical protein [Euryarchaeota archaeon]|tara:strand:+ start:18347 stop:19336 length:990 start_codon:yes stop_codon:yes gene_type:complete